MLSAVIALLAVALMLLTVSLAALVLLDTTNAVLPGVAAGTGCVTRCAVGGAATGGAVGGVGSAATAKLTALLGTELTKYSASPTATTDTECVPVARFSVRILNGETALNPALPLPTITPPTAIR
jgi:hypothetical protein